jgi:hypothetical protein
MMTTATAPKGSAADFLRADERNITAAEKKLLQTAQTSVSQTNKEAYASFLNLTPELLREEFKSDALPIHDDLVTATVDHELYQNYTFVHQLKMIEVGSRRISFAVNNYYRAFEQRSRWMREDLILVGDIEDYEKRLVEEWEIHFETMREDLGGDAAEQEKIRAARAIYNWIEKEADIPILPRCREPFITRGSYHILSDKKKVGWHPEFRARLEYLLEGKEVTE